MDKEKIVPSCKTCTNYRYTKEHSNDPNIQKNTPGNKCFDNYLDSACCFYSHRDNVFQAKTDEEMKEIYTDIIASAQNGNMSHFLQEAGREVRFEMMHNAASFAIAIDLAEKQFYKEVCYRFFEREDT